MESHWKLNINLFVLAHQLLQEHITEYDNKKYKEFSTFLQNLQRKKFDALTGEDSTKLHTYIHFFDRQLLFEAFHRRMSTVVIYCTPSGLQYHQEGNQRK